MSAHVIRLSLVALLAGFYYAVCVALGLSSIVTIVVVAYAMLAGILTMTLAVAAGGGDREPTRAAHRGSSHGDRRRADGDRARSEDALQPSTEDRRGGKRRTA